MTSDDDFNPEESTILRHAKAELERAGAFDPDADYDGAVAHHVMELLTEFVKFGHSGGSAFLALGLFNQLARLRPLSPLTADPDEWMLVADGMLDPEEPPLWQSRRNPEAFSNDEGKSYYLVSEKVQGVTPTMYTSDPNYPNKNQENTSA